VGSHLAIILSREEVIMSFRNRSREKQDNDGKYLRLTGLWPSKNKDTLWTGKIRSQDIGALLEKCEEADKDGSDIVVFLWENTKKSGRKDPDFTVQISVSEDQEKGGRSRPSRGRDDRDEPEETEEEEKEQDEEPEEKPRGRKAKEVEEPRSRRAGSAGTSSKPKADKNDW
jgi:hypothetical protein